jgi:hypothetical protein
MNVHLWKLPKSLFLSMLLIVLFSMSPTYTMTLAQTKTAQSSGTVTADQQKQLNRLQQLNEQMQRDHDAVRSAVAKYGWDSDEADAAQQRLFQDRQEYRGLRRSLQQAGVSVPPDATRTGMRNQDNQRGHCGHGANGHHGCCGGDGHCAEHDFDCCCGGNGR